MSAAGENVTTRVEITRDPIELDAYASPDAANGAVVTFWGVVRDHSGGRPVTGIFYECYEEMASKEMRRIVDEVRAESPVHGVTIVHRIGEVAAGEPSLLLVVAAAHRAGAFAAAQRIVDELKVRVPIWKKERYADGEPEWR